MRVPAARARWKEALSRLTVEGGTEEQRKIFYTALYHSLIAPNIFSDVDGRYRGMDRKVHTAADRTHYTVFSLWDTFRSEHPLLTLLEPARTRDFIETFLARLASCVERDRPELDENPGLNAAPGQFQEWLDRDCEVFEFLWQNRRLVQLVFEGGKSAQFAHLIDTFAERTRMLTKRVLEWGIKQGFYRQDLDVEVASLLIAGAYDRVARDLVKKDHKPDLRALFTEVQRIFADNLPMLHFAAPRVYIGASARLVGLTPALTRPHIMWSADTLAVTNAAR